MTDYAAVLTRNYANSEWSLNGDDYAGLVWHSDSPMPSREELDAAWPAVRDALAWDRVRAERDRLLAASDWTQVADAPVDAAAWAVYRQALRDVPQDFASPDAVVWPTAP
jgi:hypothetical protein